jgi:hypothetical protein
MDAMDLKAVYFQSHSVARSRSVEGKAKRRA